MTEAIFRRLRTLYSIRDDPALPNGDRVNVEAIIASYESGEQVPPPPGMITIWVGGVKKTDPVPFSSPWEESARQWKMEEGDGSTLWAEMGGSGSSGAPWRLRYCGELWRMDLLRLYVLQRIIHQQPTAIMNNGIIPVPDEVLKYRSLLSDLATPITLSAGEFDKVWPLVPPTHSAKH